MSSEFNNTESRTWTNWNPRPRRKRLGVAAYNGMCGKSIAAFCRDEAVSTACFHIRRAKLAAASGHAAQPAQPAAFIDLSAIKDGLASRQWRIRRNQRRWQRLESMFGSIGGDIAQTVP